MAEVDRWFERRRGAGEGCAVLVVVDIDVDDALPVGDAAESTRRHRLSRYVDRALRVGVDDGDAVVRLDHGRFGILRVGLTGECAAVQATTIARRVETSLTDRLEGHGVRLTCGGVTLDPDGSRGGRQVLAGVTGAMLAGKLLSDDRVVVVVAPAG